MIIVDFKCDDCKFIWEDNLKKAPKECPKCNSKNIFRKWGFGAFDVAEGKAGNAKTNYNTNITYHPSKFGKFKGVK